MALLCFRNVQIDALHLHAIQVRSEQSLIVSDVPVLINLQQSHLNKYRSLETQQALNLETRRFQHFSLAHFLSPLLAAGNRRVR